MAAAMRTDRGRARQGPIRQMMTLVPFSRPRRAASFFFFFFAIAWTSQIARPVVRPVGAFAFVNNLGPSCSAPGRGVPRSLKAPMRTDDGRSLCATTTWPSLLLLLATGKEGGSDDNGSSRRISGTGGGLGWGLESSREEVGSLLGGRLAYPGPRPPSEGDDVAIVGGGLAGLSAALHVRRLDPTRRVTVYDREDGDASPGGPKKTAVGSYAAAGMLAPQSERLPRGSLLDLCLASRSMFPEFVEVVEGLARRHHQQQQDQAGDTEEDDGDDVLEPWCTGYVASGGFIAPAFAGDNVATWAPPDDGGGATWLDSYQVREMEPQLHPDVVGGWWFPHDASVDARRLTRCLRAACVEAGVHISRGPESEITSLDLSDGACRGLWLKGGRYVAANSVLVANGAWMRNLLPVPIVPHKGQSLSLRMPADQPPLLRRVLFAQDTYVVPKADGRIVVGATVEAGSYDAHVTPAGLLHILTHALQLVPALKDLPVEETWAGLRPTTPDKGPILGATPWKNLFVAGGYWRNGVLLAPKTGQLIASLLCNVPLNDSDQELLDAFAWDRFTSPGKGIALAAQSRYAASIHPVHSRTSGTGVASSVGTELGSYSSARSAADERQRDRNLLMHPSEGGTDDADHADDPLERAAAMGKLDAAAYKFGDARSDVEEGETRPYEGSPDALTVGWSSSSGTHARSEDDIVPSHSDVAISSDSDNKHSLSGAGGSQSLEEAYAKIRANQAKRVVQFDDSPAVDERPDPGFRIFHQDEAGVAREVPPYTTPGDFLASLKKGEANRPSAGPSGDDSVDIAAAHLNGSERRGSLADSPPSTSTYNERTYDGYQDIQQANSRATRQEELQAMREARQRNRLDPSTIDSKNIGAGRGE